VIYAEALTRNSPLDTEEVYVKACRDSKLMPRGIATTTPIYSVEQVKWSKNLYAG